KKRVLHDLSLPPSLASRNITRTAMAPPRGGAAAAAPAALDLTGVHILEASSVPPLPERGGNAVQRKEAVDPDKDRKKEKAAAPRITGWGLREYSKIVCEKVEAKGRTTYNEFDEKNIRRRVYDAFNVLIALRVIAKEKKEIRWMGLSNYRYEKIKKLEEVRKEHVNKIRNKKALLQEIEKQFDDLQNIMLRNQTLESSAENVNGIRLPFVLVKTSRKARVEIEISDDSKFAHFEFNGAPFTLHDDLSILEGIRRNSIGRAGRATLH
uniref:E2F/DP family winged-helix DNA-binding domain-containing protein n=1 Tax=Aegilops tauschii subsp. strangulata TaxID=200361 RepID=A0A453FDF1_AEGTS